MVKYNLVWKRIEIPNFREGPRRILDDVVGKVKEAIGGGSAEHSALAAGVTTSKLTALLPTLVDKLTPEGKIPEAGLLQQGLNFLRSNLPKS